MLRYLAIICLLISACSDGSYYEKNTPITNRSWNYSEHPTFDIHVDDARAAYDIYLNLRHTAHYDFSNIFVLLHQSGKGLKDTAYRYEIPLAELDGKWKGKNAGSLFEIQHLTKADFRFPDTGKYTFRVEQNMRINPLQGVTDIGIKVVKK